MGSIRGKVDSFAPWITGFEFEGVKYGGAYETADDPRVLRFIAELKSCSVACAHRDRPFRILECGSLEGAHTAMLAQAFPRAEVYAVDVREENLRKARFLHSLHNITNVRYAQDDLDDPQSVFGQAYDAIFCVGLLYHLRHPAAFLVRACRASPLLWLWSLVCAEAEALIEDDGYRGRMLAEASEHPLSGVRSESFIPTVSSLAEMLWKAGYNSIELLERSMTSNGNGPAILLQAQRAAS